MHIIQLNLIYLESIFSAADDDITLRSAMTYSIRTSLTVFHCLQTFKNNSVNNLNFIQPLHHNEIKYQSETTASKVAILKFSGPTDY